MGKKHLLSTDMIGDIHLMSRTEESRAACGEYVGRVEYTVATDLTNLSRLLHETEGGCAKCGDNALERARPRKALT